MGLGASGRRATRRGSSAVASASPPWACGAVRPMGWGERSGGGRVEDRGLVPFGPCRRLIGHEAGWGCDGQAQDAPKAIHWSGPLELGVTVERGRGTPLEHPEPEQRPGRWGPGRPARTAIEPPVIRSSRRLKSSRRSDCEVTGWLQPARAAPGVPRLWARSSTSAPVPHRISRSGRMNLITTPTSPLRGNSPVGRS